MSSHRFSVAALERANRVTLVAAAAAALVIGVVSTAASPLIPAATMTGAFLLALIWFRPIWGVWLFVAVIATFPFGVIPVPLAGAQLTFVDTVLITTFIAVLARQLAGSVRLPLDRPAVALIGFVLVAIAALVAGGSVSPVTPELVRRTAKLLVSLLFFLIARSVLTGPDHLARLTRYLMFAGAVQGAIGVGLKALSPMAQLDLLTRLQIIGYPTQNVLRFVPGANNTYTNQLRAIGTSVDPNVFGGTLMLALALIVVQWASPEPVLRKRALALLAVPTAAGVLLSLSRASWIGLGAALLLIGILRYRRILLLGVLVCLGVLVTPTGQAFVARFVGGFSRADPATAFRFGEYTNALTLLGRYPLLGIGFGASPDIDVTAGVSSVYLLVAEQTGLLGLAVYLGALVTSWCIGVAALQQVRRTEMLQAGRGTVIDDARLQGMLAAFFAAFSGALMTGLLDHYFANQAFPHAVALFWLYAAALVSASQLVRRGGSPPLGPLSG